MGLSIHLANVHFTQHALARMAERKVTKDEVIGVLRNPREVVTANEERFEARGLVDRDSRVMLLRVIYEHGEVISVITVVATSKLAKYGVTP